MDPRADDERRAGRGGARLHRGLSGPAVSLVAALRNEQYGGDLFARARAFLRNVDWLAQRLDVDVEVVLVEWAPLVDAPPLASVLTHDGPAHVRVVTVPREVAAERCDDADEIALWIFAAKNVGVRRARSDWIVATNPDVLYTPPLFASITRGELDDRSFFRTSRFDVAAVDLDAEPERQLAQCRRSIVRANMIGDSIRFDSPSGGWTVAKALRRYAKLQRTNAPATPVERAERPTEWLHTNASGDFFLMHRERWHELCGYPEFASAGHLDAYIVVMAASAGLQQVVLAGSRRLYHLEHARAIDWERPEQALHYYVPYETFLADAKELLLGRRPAAFNDAGWGFAGVDLPEVELRAGAAPSS